MKLKQNIVARLLALLTVVLFVSSCDDQDLASKNEGLGASIGQLTKEIALLKADLKESPEALALKLQQLNLTLKKADEHAQALQDAKLELNMQRAELELQIEEFRRKLREKK